MLAAAVAVVSPRAAGGWTYALTDHFEIYTTGSEKSAREVLRDFERVRAFFQSYLDLAPARGLPVRLIVFSGPKEYAPLRPNAVAEAFYQAGADRDVIVMQSADADARPVVIHEYAHLAFRRAGAAYPIWLNEGLAEFFSTMWPEGSRMRLGLVPERRLAPLDGRTPLIPLERLFAVDQNAAEYNAASHAGLLYSECWAMAHMLLTDDRYRSKAPALLAMLSTGTAAADALTAVYGRTVNAVFLDLQNYIRRRFFSYVLTGYTPPSGELHIAVRPAAAFEAGVVTAAVLGGMDGRARAARAAFDLLASQNPDDLLLLESRGLFEFDHGSEVDALPYFSRAVDAGSRNARLYRVYAGLIAPDEQREEAFLAKAMALDPDNLETRVVLARMFVRQRRPDQAIETLSIATPAPADLAFPFYEAQAHAAIQAGRDDLARRAVANADQAARTSEQIDAAGRLTAMIGAGGAGAGGPERVASGRLTNVVCSGGPSIIEVTTAVTRLRLVIDDPRAVTIGGRAGATAQLECGPQDRPVRAGYRPADDADRKTHGVVRFLSFD